MQTCAGLKFRSDCKKNICPMTAVLAKLSWCMWHSNYLKFNFSDHKHLQARLDDSKVYIVLAFILPPSYYKSFNVHCMSLILVLYNVGYVLYPFPFGYPYKWWTTGSISIKRCKHIGSCLLIIDLLKLRPDHISRNIFHQNFKERATRPEPRKSFSKITAIACHSTINLF